MLRFWFVFSATTFSSYNPDIAKKGASPGGVTPLRWRARGPNQGGKRCQTVSNGAQNLMGVFVWEDEDTVEGTRLV